MTSRSELDPRLLIELRTRIAQAMFRDQAWLRRQLDWIERRQRQQTPFDRKFETWSAKLNSSVALRSKRAESLPHIEFDPELPIVARRKEIGDAIREHQVVVVAGETGSGKSTQLPKICLAEGFGIGGMIGHTQPRRIAARSVAARIAEETKTTLGSVVGYRVRFQDQTHPNSLVKLMTDGMLLAETASDPRLEQYEVLILDEAHERSVNIDFLLGLLKRLLPTRPDLRVVITSATIDAERFGAHFGDSSSVPVIVVEGRTYPVEVRYRPLQKENEEVQSPELAILCALEELGRRAGDVLVFFPTERDIREAAKYLRSTTIVRDTNAEVLPLYARLSMSDQDRIFHPGNKRRIVLATNVAESSLTVPRIHAVIDLGTARMSRFSPRMRMQRLPIEPVSRASADQRKGRCGRLGPGICIRLYSEEDFLARPPYTTPEIRRNNLASVILQAQALGLGDLAEIPFLDPPLPEAVREGYRTLVEIGAVDDRQTITERGRIMANMPVDPRIARMVLAGAEEDCLHEILIIAAALEVQDPRLRPIEQQQAADERHARFVDERSDFISFLKLWDYIERQSNDLSRSKFESICGREFLSTLRIREWHEIHRQLREIAQGLRLTTNSRKDDYAAIHRALLTGLLSCAAYRTSDFEYTGAGGNKFHIWPGSGLFQKKRTWIVAAELVETNRKYGRTVAAIEPAWLESLGASLLKRSFSDPHWHPPSQSVMAFESVTLFGLPIVARRRVRYGWLDPPLSRQLFIEHGLVAGEMDAREPFLLHNQEVLAAAEKLAAQTRQREYLLDEYAIHAFYQARIPDDVTDMSSLRAAMKRNAELRPKLEMTLADLVSQPTTTIESASEQFPTTMTLGSMVVPVSYHFEPGSDQDGVTITVPVEGVPQISSQQLEWLVPGLIEEKIVALIRSLPKLLRRSLVPAPDTARRIAASLQFGEGDFLSVVAQKLSALADERITVDLFRTDKLPPHLNMRVRVIDAQGTEVSAERGVKISGQINSIQSPSTDVSLDRQTPPEWLRNGITTWDFGSLPSEIRLARGGIEVSQFPAVVDQVSSVGLRLTETAEFAKELSRRGICRLYFLLHQKALRTQVRWLPNWDRLCIWVSTVLDKTTWEEGLQWVLADRAFLGNSPLPQDPQEFERRQREAGSRIAVATQDLAGLVPKLAEQLHRSAVAFESIKGTRWQTSADDVGLQWKRLLPSDFLLTTPWERLLHYPRYLQGIEYRIEKLKGGGQSRDEGLTRDLAPWEKRHREMDPTRLSPAQQQALQEYRWMLEELRVSWFAQPLGTVIKISPQRLEKQWDLVRGT